MPFEVINPDGPRSLSLYGCCIPTVEEAVELATTVLREHVYVSRLIVREYGEIDPCGDFLGNDPPPGAHWNSIGGYIYERPHAGRTVEVHRKA